MRRAEASPVQAGLDLLAVFFSPLSTLRRPNGGGKEASIPSPGVSRGETAIVTKDPALQEFRGAANL